MSKAAQKTNGSSYTPRQHFIPQCLLKNFTAEKKRKGHLFQYRKSDRDIRQRNTNEIAFKPHLYSIETETARDDKVEKYFSKLEDVASHIIEKVIADRSLSDISNDDIVKLARFLISLYFRSAHAVNFIAARAPAELDIIKKKLATKYPGKKAKIDSFIDAISAKGAFYAETFIEGCEDNFQKVIRHMEMALYEIPSGYFVLSDKYAVLCPKPIITLEPQHSQIENTHAIYGPISSQLCIVFRERKAPDPAGLLSYHKDLQSLTDLQLAQINRLAVRSCNQYLYCEDEETLRRFTKRLCSPLMPHIQRLSCSAGSIALNCLLP